MCVPKFLVFVCDILDCFGLPSVGALKVSIICFASTIGFLCSIEGYLVRVADFF